MAQKKVNRLLMVLLIILILTFSINLYSFCHIGKTVEIMEIDSNIIVSDKLGFDLNSTSLTFGNVLAGGSSSREITIKNDYGFPIQVYIEGKGEIKEFIIPHKEEIKTGGREKISVTALVPENTKFGKYAGKVIVNIKRLKEE